MIKKFEQYIRESLEIDEEFEFLDNVQALIDSWEDKLEIGAGVDMSNEIYFKFYLKNRDNFTLFKEFSKDLNDFINDLETILESLSVEKIRYDFEVSFGSERNKFITIKLYLHKSITFPTLVKMIKEENLSEDVRISYSNKRPKKKFNYDDWRSADIFLASEFKYILLDILVNKDESYLDIIDFINNNKPEFISIYNFEFIEDGKNLLLILKND